MRVSPVGTECQYSCFVSPYVVLSSSSHVFSLHVNLSGLDSICRHLISKLLEASLKSPLKMRFKLPFVITEKIDM